MSQRSASFPHNRSDGSDEMRRATNLKICTQAYIIHMLLGVVYIDLQVPHIYIHRGFGVFGNMQRPNCAKIDINANIHIYTLDVISEIYLHRSTKKKKSLPTFSKIHFLMCIILIKKSHKKIFLSSKIINQYPQKFEFSP